MAKQKSLDQFPHRVLIYSRSLKDNAFNDAVWYLTDTLGLARQTYWVCVYSAWFSNDLIFCFSDEQDAVIFLMWAKARYDAEPFHGTLRDG